MHVESVSSNVPVPEGGGRSEGVHLSRVLRNIALANHTLSMDYADDFSLIEVQRDNTAWWETLDVVNQLRIALGLAWEDWYLPRLQDVIYHPGETELDGIFMTPDGESLGYLLYCAWTICVHECKVTYKSRKRVAEHGIQGQWMWIAQLKAYCKAKGTDTGFLHVLWVCGDYKFPIRPVLDVWKIVFTDAELDDHWDVVTVFKQEQDDED